MPRIDVIVEGQTEEAFVNTVLAPYILALNAGAILHPIVIETGRERSGKKYRGGLTKFAHLRGDIVRALGNTAVICVTSFVDLFGLREDFPGVVGSAGLPFRKRVEALESAFADEIGSDRFVPYIATHEFEALLLSNPEAIVRAAGGSELDLRALAASVAGFDSPEAINGNSPPSYRIENVLAAYDKVRHGTIAAQEIGVEAMLKSCEHFENWFQRLLSEFAAVA